MNPELLRAAALLKESAHTLVLLFETETVTSDLRGIRPLLDLLDSSRDFSGFVAADRIVGKAAALLYVRLGVRAVFAEVLSSGGKAVLEEHGIEVAFDTLTEKIVARTGKGICPMEQTVQFICDPKQAETALRDRVWQLQTDNHLQQEVETALRGRRRFKDTLFIPFAKAILQYALLEEGDRVAVCISGGKDSMLMAKLFQELQRHRKFPFELVFLTMDPGYAEENRALLQENARALGVPLTVFESDIFDSVFHVEKSPCYLCARMRRGHLYKTAKELGCNKIALGHHFDDVIETNLMSMLWGGQIQSMPPKLKSKNFPGMELIRPLYFVRETDIEAWRDYHKLRFLACACRFTEQSETQPDVSKRKETKALIAQLHKTNPRVEANIFASMENVALDTVLGYRAKGVYHGFLENYIKEEET